MADDRSAGSPDGSPHDPADDREALKRRAADERIHDALVELKQAKEHHGRGASAAALTSAKRAAGIALEGALLVAPNRAWGRSHLEHIAAIAYDRSVAPGVSRACHVLLRANGCDYEVLDRAFDVVAHAWFVIHRNDPMPPPPPDEISEAAHGIEEGSIHE